MINIIDLSNFILKAERMKSMNLGHMKILERKQSQKTSGFIFFYELESCFRSKTYLYGSGSSDPYREKTDLEPNLMNPAVVDPTK